MPVALRPLKLPQMVEEQKARESLVMERSLSQSATSFHTQNSSSTDISAPPTPVFSTRGHSRLPSSTSSLDVTSQPAPTSSPSSPTLPNLNETIKSPKRSLPDVEEEPQEKDEDYQMLDAPHGFDICQCCDETHQHLETSFDQAFYVESRSDDYDFADGFLNDDGLDTTLQAKKHRSGDSTFSGLASRIGTRFPLFSRRRRQRSHSAATTATASTRDFIPSRPQSIRSPSLSDTFPFYSDLAESELSNTAESVPIEHDDYDSLEPIDIGKANREEDETRHGLATTPLLPPMMVPESANASAPIQSPLQSPAVAAETSPITGPNSPVEIPNVASIPSTPLSNKPSISSFRRRPVSNLIPSSEIPPMQINEPCSSTWARGWAEKLGHANFNIHPEPYHPDVLAPGSRVQFRANWDQARTNYTKHLVRTGEHYGATSTTYQLTEEKWAEVDAQWQSANALFPPESVSYGNTIIAGPHNASKVNERPHDLVVTRIPALNDLQSNGKFPKLGDDEIVGPMVQYAARLQRKPSKRTTMFSFLQALKFPSRIMTGRP